MDEPSLGEVSRQIAGLDARVQRVLDDHEGRLRRSERWIYALPPTFLLAVGSLIAALVTGGR